LYSVPGLNSGRRKGRTIADTFIVAGIVELGFYEYDAKLAVIGFRAARRFLHQGNIARWVEIRIDDLFASQHRRIELGRYLAGFSLLDIQHHIPELVDKYESATAIQPVASNAGTAIGNVNEVLGTVKFSNISGEMAMGYRDEYRLITWEEMNRPLFTSMKRQRIVLSLFFLIIIVVAAFNIVSSQVMIVREKASDIAILRAMGASSRQVQRIFQIQGMAVGLVGTAVGLGLALGVCALLKFVGFPLDPKVYFVSYLPIHLQISDVILSSTISLVAIYLAVTFAARRAASKAPVEGLRDLD
jgi:ABC-type lipoprotein release transport system permease subunit